jgi:hypothetical protein
MLTETNRGLAGRARKVHHRSRAERLYAQQLIDDYYDPDPVEREEDRFIPIGRRNDFLPAVASAMVEQAPRTDAQLELPLTDDRSNGHKHGQKPLPSSLKNDDANEVVIQFRPDASSDVTKTPRPVPDDVVYPLEVQEKPRFTIHGFLVGCAVGGGAAAVMLLLLQLVL